jgi:hypothetical protein
MLLVGEVPQNPATSIRAHPVVPAGLIEITPFGSEFLPAEFPWCYFGSSGWEKCRGATGT